MSYKCRSDVFKMSERSWLHQSPGWKGLFANPHREQLVAGGSVGAGAQGRSNPGQFGPTDPKTCHKKPAEPAAPPPIPPKQAWISGGNRARAMERFFLQSRWHISVPSIVLGRNCPGQQIRWKHFSMMCTRAPASSTEHQSHPQSRAPAASTEHQPHPQSTSHIHRAPATATEHQPQLQSTSSLV
jgi:hypothetical protein